MEGSVRGAIAGSGAAGARERGRGLAWRMVALSRAAILACALGAAAPAAAAEGAARAGVPQARDLAADGRDARASGRVIVVLFGSAGCPWCQRVREEFLQPMLAGADGRRRVIVREIDVEAHAALADFGAAATTHARFAAAHRVRFVPTLAFLGPDGAALAEPLVGFRTADYFGYYLDARIDAALAKLRARPAH